MKKSLQKIGFTYFSSPENMVTKQIEIWMPSLRSCGGSYVIFQGNFDVAVNEDAFIAACDHDLEPLVHFNSTLPSAKTFNETSLLLDVYKKWGCKYVILGDRPNTKSNWAIADWHYETLVERFLDCFIPLAYHCVRIGLDPILAPLQPDGDYWDCAFLELLLDGLYQRKMTSILDHLTLSSYGYTYNKPLTWGAGGPERWPGSKPYQTPKGQEDQIGFNNFEWVQAAGERLTGKKMPVIILDAGRPTPNIEQPFGENAIGVIKKIINANSTANIDDFDFEIEHPSFNQAVIGCTFSLETLRYLLGEGFSLGAFEQLFGSNKNLKKENLIIGGNQKSISHYLLLPSYASGVSDAVLNKVRPIIKKLRPTVGFSLEEASHAEKVSIFPDPFQFSDEQIDQLRASGCKVDLLPENGIEIATNLQTH